MSSIPSLTGDEIDEVTGILNGTTNYMLYKMSTEGCEFDTVLKEAQQKGYAGGRSYRRRGRIRCMP